MKRVLKFVLTGGIVLCLVVITLLAVSIYGHKNSDTERLIRSLGGTIGYDWRGDIINIDLQGTRVQDQDLLSLQTLPQLRVLNLSHTAVGDNGATVLERSRTITHLDVTATRMTDYGIAKLALMPRLSVLVACDMPISDRVLEEFSESPSIEYLYLARTNVTDPARRRLMVTRSSVKQIDNFVNDRTDLESKRGRE